jgi:DNA-binding transcriptional ArsR family regulator
MSEWTFITNHGAVLALVGQEGKITAREVAARLNITERSVMRIIKDLEEANYLVINRVGRVNHYQVNIAGTLRRLETRDMAVGKLLNVLRLDSE